MRASMAHTPPKKFTQKQRDFIKWYVCKDCLYNGTEACRRAGYKGSDSVLAQMARENLRKPHIRAEIDRLISEAARGANVTIEYVLRELLNTYERAAGEGKYNSAVRSLELMGKHLKMFTDRIEHIDHLEDISDAELYELLKQLSESGDVDIRAIIARYAEENGAIFGPPGTATTH